MKNLLILSLLIVSVYSHANCVHEKTLKGSDLLKENFSSERVYVETEDSIYKPFYEVKIDAHKVYNVQITHGLKKNKNSGDYNSKYIEYYGYPRMQQYLTEKKSQIDQAGYELKVIGKSLKGRNLFSLTPKNLIKKKTIVMFGRHHGDEGTANWIIEGFLNEYLTNKKFRDEYQLLLYPMVNPDGAEAHSRYNANGRDLNRSWSKNPKKDFDEIKTIHGDLRKFMKKVGKEVFIVLDMHGSFTEDFIYRVKRNYVSIDFYNKQQNFIDELSIYDPWQDGNFKLSNGDNRMARLVMVNHYKKNALTHETIRDIPKNNRAGRDKKSLMDQGVAVLKSIQNLY